MTSIYVDEEEELIELEEEVADRKRSLVDAEMSKALKGIPENEFAFNDISDRPDWVVLYATSDGEPIPFPDFMKSRMLRKKNEDGQRMFTTRKASVPKYTLGTLKCFKHPDAEEAPVIKGLGIAQNCKAKHIPNEWAKETHEFNKHKRERNAYQRYLDRKRDDKFQDERKLELSAMMELAKAAAGRGPGRPRKDEVDA